MGTAEIEAVAKVIRSGQLFRNQVNHRGECDGFEIDLATMFSINHALLVNSGTSALVCALVGCDIGPGDEVIVPAFTFMATAMAVLGVGAIPVLADINKTLTLDATSVEHRITSRTKAVIPVHIFGLPCDMNQLMEVARRHDLKVIEDACQAFGGTYEGAHLGTIGDAGAFSFNFFKAITAGEGGAIVTNDDGVYGKALYQHDATIIFDEGSRLRCNAFEAAITPFVGGDFRCSEIQGAILRQQLHRLQDILFRLKKRQNTLRDVLQGSHAYQLAPLSSDHANCSSIVALEIDEPSAARRCVEKLLSHQIPAQLGIDCRRNIYLYWTPIVQKRGALHAKLNPFSISQRQYEYTEESCLPTLDILAKTIGIPVYIDEPLEVAQKRGQSVRRIAESL